tara:strand:- start:404 stop:685 length:282 start_codon:yes stop_codon:yes gene_type:complete
MRNLKFYISTIFCFLQINVIFSDKNLAEINTNSIIKMFCIESVKAEFIKANLEYKEDYGKNVCDCYIENLSRKISHDVSINECKKDFKELIDY